MLTDQFPEIDNRQHLVASIDHSSFNRLVRQCLDEDRDERTSASELITTIVDLKEGTN